MAYERMAATDIAALNTTVAALGSAPAGGGSGTTVKVATSNFSQGSSVLADVTGLSFAAAINTLYEIDVLLKLQSNGGNTTYLFAIQFSAAGASCSWAGIATASASAKTMIGSTAIASMGGTNIANDGSMGVVAVRGWVLTGANLGNITVQISGGSNGSGTVVYVGSRMTVTPL